MTTDRRFKWLSGRLPDSPLRRFWQPPPALDAADPQIPSLPLETASGGGGDHTITASGFVNAQAFGSVGLNGQIAPAGLGNAQAFGTAGMNGQVGVAGFANASTLGAVALQAQIGATGVPSGQAFGAVGLNGLIAPSGVVNVVAVGTAALNGEIDPTSVGNAQAFGQPKIEIQASHPIEAVGFANASVLGQPAVTPEPVLAHQGAVQGYRPFRRRTVHSGKVRLNAHRIEVFGIEGAIVLGVPTIGMARRPNRMRRGREEEAMLLFRIAA